MRAVLPDKLQAARIKTGQFASRPEDGGYGAFRLMGPCGEELVIIACAAAVDDADAEGWEHVSISTKRRNPNWQEMSFVKDLFWDDEECVRAIPPAEICLRGLSPVLSASVAAENECVPYSTAADGVMTQREQKCESDVRT
jgi:hypothetical protein